MSDAAAPASSERIVVDETFPHPPAAVWAALTSSALMARWLGMTPVGFEPVVGNRFTYQTTPGGCWDGIIRCEVLEVSPLHRLTYSWSSGDPGNEGYGAPLDTVVTFWLEPVAGGTRLQLVHTGFALPRNETAYRSMSGGWIKVVARIGALAASRRRPGS